MTSLRCFLYVMLIGIIVIPMSGGCASSPSRVREIDPQADASFKQMCKILDGAKALHFRVQATMERRVDTGQLAEFHRTSDVLMVRPDRLMVKTDSDDGQWSAWYRGNTLTVLDRETNEYAVEKVPGRIDEMLDYLAEEYDLVMPMADLLIGKTYDSLLADVESGIYVGLHDVGETKCHHLLFRQDNLQWQIWIDAGEQPLPRKLTITYNQEPDEPRYVATIDDWNLAPVLSEETFIFTSPADAKSVPMSDLIEEKE